jgi:hypothetical protein
VGAGPISTTTGRRQRATVVRPDLECEVFIAVPVLVHAFEAARDEAGSWAGARGVMGNSRNGVAHCLPLLQPDHEPSEYPVRIG